VGFSPTKNAENQPVRPDNRERTKKLHITRGSHRRKLRILTRASWGLHHQKLGQNQRRRGLIKRHWRDQVLGLKKKIIYTKHEIKRRWSEQPTGVEKTKPSSSEERTHLADAKTKVKKRQLRDSPAGEGRRGPK